MSETKTQGATPLIYGKIAEVMSNLNAISKDRNNVQQGFKFRGIDDVMNTLHGVLAKAGVFIVPNVLHEERTERESVKNGFKKATFYTRLTIEFTFYAADGSNVKSVVIGEAMDNGDKASNKALSIAYKYACLQVFCIPTEEEKDPDANSYEVAPKNAGNGSTQPVQAPAVNNRVNYQTQQQQAPQYNTAPQNNGRYYAPQQQQAPAPQYDAQASQAAAVFANMQHASEIPQPQQRSAPGVNSGVIF